jgi:hypothetical protein
MQKLFEFDHASGERLTVSIEPIRDDTIIHITSAVEGSPLNSQRNWSESEIGQALLALWNEAVTRDDVADEFADMRAMALDIAKTNGLTMVVGWQYSDDTDDDREPGYCPLEAVGPATVYEITEIVWPSGKVVQLPKATPFAELSL